MKVEQITALMNGYNAVEISQQSGEVLFVGLIDEWREYPHAAKLGGLTVDHIAPMRGDDNTIMIICK